MTDAKGLSEYPSGVAVYEFPKSTCGGGHKGQYVNLREYNALAERLKACEAELAQLKRGGYAASQND